MPGIITDEIVEEGAEKGLNGNPAPHKETSVVNTPLTNVDAPVDQAVHTSIEQLCENLCDMQSSDQSPSRRSFESYGDESRIDSDLRNLVGGGMREIEIMEEEEEDARSISSSKKSVKLEKGSRKSDSSEDAKKIAVAEPEVSSKSDPKGKSPSEKPPTGKKSSLGPVGAKGKKGKLQSGNEHQASESKVENLDLGRYLLKQAKDLISAGDNPQKALELALRATQSFEACSGDETSLEVVMCLHVTAAIYCSLGRYSEAVPVLSRSVEIPALDQGQEHALAKFAGYMQLGDTYAMLSQLENSVTSYRTGLEIQKSVLGENDPRVGETCRYLAEALVQALRFNEAEEVCQMAIEIHKENKSTASLQEAMDRRLMGLICETKGDHEGALEHLVLASMAYNANGEDAEVASVDCSIGDTYLALSRYDEAVFAYQKALTAYKTTKGENHPVVGSVFVRLADLYNRTGKTREAKSYCENALRIYDTLTPGIPPEEIATGLADISAIYESMNEPDRAVELLRKALKMYNDAPGQQSTVAGIEAQMGVMYYMLGKYSESYNSFKSSVSKLRATGEKKSSFFGIALNQMGLACVQRYAIKEAVELFEEARSVLEQECGPYHPDTLGVYSNLAGTYDAMGRLDDAIQLLEFIVGMREEKLGTANPDVEDEKMRLAELLKDAGRDRGRKARSLETLLDANSQTVHNGGIAKERENQV